MKNKKEMGFFELQARGFMSLDFFWCFEGVEEMNVPTNDEECRALLKDVCGRTEKQIDAIFQFSKLIKELKEDEWKR